jgi:hypothetical protein
MEYKGDAENQEYVESALEEIEEKQTDEQQESIKYEEEKKRVESQEEYLGTLQVRGETVNITDTLGIGERARIMQTAQDLDGKPESQIDESEVLSLILKQIDALASVTDRGEDFFDKLDVEELRDAFQSVGQVSKSKEGN